MMLKARSLFPVLSAGWAVSWALQFLSKVPLEQRSFTGVFVAEGPRLLLSGLAGSAVFALLFLASSRNEKVRQGLSLFNVFFLCFVLQSSSLALFIALLVIVLTATGLKMLQPGNSFSMTVPGAKNFFIATLIIAYFSLAPLLYQNSADFFELSRAAGSLSYLALPVLFLPKGRRLYLLLLILFLTVHALPPVYHYKEFGSKMPASLYFEIMISPFSELKEYIGSHLDLPMILLLLCFLLLPAALIFMVKKEPGGSFSGGIPLVVLALVLSFGNCNYRKNVLYGYYRNFSDYREQLKLYNRELASRKERKVRFSGLEDGLPASKAATFVCIIGEATARHHMSLYGYFRNTSPMLEAMRNDLFIFQDVISPHSHTQPAMEKIITFANHGEMEPFYKEGSLVELFRQAGYKTYWLSNQYAMGKFENVTSAIAADADQSLFVNTEEEERSCDEKLLRPLRLALEEKRKKKFIVLHLMGTHADYSMRYPSGFGKFGSTGDIPLKGRPFLDSWALAKINEYDNAVLYNDQVVHDIIQLVKEKTGYSWVLYFPDHGEEVYDSRPYFSHQEADATPYMFEIPFIAWFSEEYRRENKARVDSFSHYLRRKYQTDDVIHSMIDLSGIRLNRFNPAKSIFNTGFREEKRVMNGRDYDSARKELVPGLK